MVHATTPPQIRITVRGGADTIAFHDTAFGAREVTVTPDPGGTTTSIRIDLGGTDGPDAVTASAENAGAGITMPAQRMFRGAYCRRIVDPFAHAWSFAAER